MRGARAGLAAAGLVTLATAAWAQWGAPAGPGLDQAGGPVSTARMAALLGSTANVGHTVTPITVVFSGGVAAGGTTVTASGIADPVSGNVPGTGAQCQFIPATAVLFPASLTVACVFSAAGSVSVRAVPLGGLPLAAQSLTGNVFWTW